jgi:hypothetical protein
VNLTSPYDHRPLSLHSLCLQSSFILYTHLLHKYLLTVTVMEAKTTAMKEPKVLTLESRHSWDNLRMRQIPLTLQDGV